MKFCCGDAESEAHMDTHPRTRGIPDLDEIKILRPNVQEQE